MKSKIYPFLRTLSIAASLLLFVSSNATSAEYVSVTKDGVNVRTGPSTNDPVYMELFIGYPLKVLEKKGDWLKVQDFEKDTGWVYSALVEDKSTVIVSTSSKVNMRSGPGKSNPVIANIDRGVVLDLVERKKHWVKVRHLSGTEGWIYAPLLWP